MEIISRAEWGARPPTHTPVRIPTPTRELWLHHTASPSGFSARVRAVQDFHMDVRGWSDIAYSFLVNHEGLIYEGRGAGIAGGHTQGHNAVSHAICVMGNYELSTPTQACLDAVVELARYGFDEGWWPQVFTGGHRDASGANTSCPGDNLYSKLPLINKRLREDDEMTPEQEARILSAIAGVPAANWKYPQKDDPTVTSTFQYVLRTYNAVADIQDVTDAELQELADAVNDELARRAAG